MPSSSPVIKARRLLLVMPVTASIVVYRAPAGAWTRGSLNRRAGVLVPSSVRVGSAICSKAGLARTPLWPTRSVSSRRRLRAGPWVCNSSRCCATTLPAVDADSVAARLSLIRPHLDGRAWRWLRGAQAKVFDCGGFNGSRVAVVENRLRRRGRPGHQVCGSCGPVARDQPQLARTAPGTSARSSSTHSSQQPHPAG